MEAMWGLIVEAFKYSGENSALIDPDESLYNFFEKRSLSLFEGEDNSEQQRKKLLQMAELWGAFVGSPVQKQSLKFFWLEVSNSGEHILS